MAVVETRIFKVDVLSVDLMMDLAWAVELAEAANGRETDMQPLLGGELALESLIPLGSFPWRRTSRCALP